MISVPNLLYRYISNQVLAYYWSRYTKTGSELDVEIQKIVACIRKRFRTSYIAKSIKKIMNHPQVLDLKASASWAVRNMHMHEVMIFLILDAVQKDIQQTPIGLGDVKKSISVTDVRTIESL